VSGVAVVAVVVAGRRAPGPSHCKTFCISGHRTMRVRHCGTDSVKDWRFD